MGVNGATGGAAYTGLYAGAGVHHFDTGLHRPLRSVIRQALIERLSSTPTGNGRALLKSAGGYLARIAALPRPLKGETDEELSLVFVALQGATPSLCVALGRMELSSAGGGEAYEGELEVAVYALSRNFRSLVDGRLSPDAVATADPTADPGVETMLEHVREVLCGQELDVIGVHELRPRTEDEVCTDGEGSLWEQRYQLRVDVVVNPERANSEVVETVEIQHISNGAPAPLVSHTDIEPP